MSASQAEPRRSRPDIEASYGVPKDEVGMLGWSHVATNMAAARSYWLSTIRPDGRPHTVPVWGVWLDGTLYFGGGRTTRKARNLAVNTAVTVHLPDAEQAVIFEGVAEEITDTALHVAIDDAYEAKYGVRHGTPVWALRPTVVFAWTEYPTTVTRWTF